MNNSTIQWTDTTWNPIVGCSKVSPGCQNCYAIKDAHRLAGNPNPKIGSVYTGLTERRGDRTEWTGQARFVPERLEQPLRWRKPRRIFVNSMSDLFHESVTDEQLDQIFAVMALTPQHTYQVLTKRPERMLGYFQQFSERAKEHGGERWLIHEVAKDIVGEDELIGGKYQHQKMYDLPLPNVWLGVTVENQKTADERIPLLLQTPTAVRFLSCEPLLEEIDLCRIKSWHPVHGPDGMDCLQGGSWGHESVRRLSGDPRSPGFCNHSDSPTINWVIVGGESGPKARPCDITWIRSIVEQCSAVEVPCFVKQLGSKAISKVAPGLQMDWSGRQGWGKGGNPDEWPEDLRVREFPG